MVTIYADGEEIFMSSQKNLYRKYGARRRNAIQEIQEACRELLDE